MKVDPHHYARAAVRRRFPSAEIVLSSGGSMYMVQAGERFLSGPKATITRAWMEAAAVAREAAPLPPASDSVDS